MRPNPAEAALNPADPIDAAASLATSIADRQAVRTARRRAGAKLGFLIHASVYVLVNAVLIGIDWATAAPGHWAQFPLMGWGLGLAIHGLAVWLMPNTHAVYRRLLARELRRAQVAQR